MTQPLLQKFGSDNFEGEICCRRSISLSSRLSFFESRFLFGGNEMANEKQIKSRFQ
jgi:hypothetical protein